MSAVKLYDLFSGGYVGLLVPAKKPRAKKVPKAFTGKVVGVWTDSTNMVPTTYEVVRDLKHPSFYMDLVDFGETVHAREHEVIKYTPRNVELHVGEKYSRFNCKRSTIISTRRGQIRIYEKRGRSLKDLTAAYCAGEENISKLERTAFEYKFGAWDEMTKKLIMTTNWPLLKACEGWWPAPNIEKLTGLMRKEDPRPLTKEVFGVRTKLHVKKLMELIKLGNFQHIHKIRLLKGLIPHEWLDKLQVDNLWMDDKNWMPSLYQDGIYSLCTVRIELGTLIQQYSNERKFRILDSINSWILLSDTIIMMRNLSGDDNNVEDPEDRWGNVHVETIYPFTLPDRPNTIRDIHDHLSIIKQNRAEEIRRRHDERRRLREADPEYIREQADRAARMEEMKKERKEKAAKQLKESAAFIPTIDQKVVGKWTIKVARDAGILVEWGAKMHNCIAGYDDRVEFGECILFGVYEGAELYACGELVIYKGAPEMRQLSTFCNAPLPSEEYLQISTALGCVKINDNDPELREF